MKYLKTYEAKKIEPFYAYTSGDDVVEQIKDFAVEILEEEQSFYDDCPFASEIAILHQQDYIKDVYESIMAESFYNIRPTTEEEFIKIYNTLIVKARKKILDAILKDPSLYGKWNLDYEGLDIPDYIKNASKYNL